MKQVVLELPDDIAREAEREASLVRLPLEAFLAGSVASRLASKVETGTNGSLKLGEGDLSVYSDEALMALIRTPLPKSVGHRISVLQDARCERKLSQEEQQELDAHMSTVHSSTLLKALALDAWRERHGSLPAVIEAAW
jgi:hypothetical protein